MNNEYNKNGVLLIHGFTSTPQAIIDLAETIHKENFKVFLPKLPGHCTKWEDLASVTFEDWINALENKALKLLKTSDKINIVGLSMGGTLAAILTERLREKANTLTLICAPFVSKFSHSLGYSIGRLFLKSVNGVGGDIKSTEKQEEYYNTVPVKAVGEFLKTVKVGKRSLPNIKIPVRLFYAKDDHVISNKNPKETYRLLGSSDKKLKVFTNSYHVMTLDNDAPELFDDIIEFLKEYN